MKQTSDSQMVASRLVAELGEDAARHAKCRLVELTAAANLRAASFWREVMRLCEDILDRESVLNRRSSNSPEAAHSAGTLVREAGTLACGMRRVEEKRPG
jgi:hypothetical protein